MLENLKYVINDDRQDCPMEKVWEQHLEAFDVAVILLLGGVPPRFCKLPYNLLAILKCQAAWHPSLSCVHCGLLFQ